MKIGFFDSGIGGISVLYDSLKLLPKEEYIYFADTENVPYGTKTKDDVRKFVFDAVEFILDKGIKALVIACNTATSIAIGELRQKYTIPIIGMEPAVKPAIEKIGNSNKRVLVTATPLAIKEEKLKNLIAKLDNESVVDLLPLPGLVNFSEKLEFDEEIVVPYLREQLKCFDLQRYDTVVLGCTHFTFFKDIFKRLLPSDINVIDGNLGTVRNLKRTLENLGALEVGNGKVTYYNSGVEAVSKPELDRYCRLFTRLADIYKE